MCSCAVFRSLNMYLWTINFCILKKAIQHFSVLIFDLNYEINIHEICKLSIHQFEIETIFSRGHNREKFVVRQIDLVNNKLSGVRAFMEKILGCWFFDDVDERTDHEIGFGSTCHQITPINSRGLKKWAKIWILKLWHSEKNLERNINCYLTFKSFLVKAQLTCIALTDPFIARVIDSEFPTTLQSSTVNTFGFISRQFIETILYEKAAQLCIKIATKIIFQTIFISSRTNVDWK